MNASPRTRSDGYLPSRVLLCVLMSGAAGLVFEICWIRVAALQFGSTIYATSLVLAVFFLGLGLGSQAFGARSRRTTRPLEWVALLELGVCALALASLPGFGWAEHLYDKILRHVVAGSALAWTVHAMAIALVVLPPTLLMGGTLPMVCRYAVRHDGEVGAVIARLYGLNTLGAAAGAALAGFVLIPVIGITRTVWLAACLNVVAAALVWTCRAPVPAPRLSGHPENPATNRSSLLLLACLFVSGFAALGQEVVWTRFLALVVRNTVYTYTLTILVVLSGILLGSLTIASRLDHVKHRAALLAALLGAQGFVVIGLITLPASVWTGFTHPTLVFFALMLVPSMLSGASFPLSVRILVAEPGLAGAGLGRAMALNTIGGIVGALVAGFLLLPVAGLSAGIQIMAAASLCAGGLAWLSDPRNRWTRNATLVVLAIALAFFALPRLSATRIPGDYLANGGELVDLREGLQSNLAIVRREGVLSLEIDRWWQGESRKTHQVMAAHLPTLLHPNPRRVLVVGVGAGQTPARFLMYNIERLDCVDIEPAVFDLIRPHFDSGWMSDRRLHLVTADGRGYVTHSREQWDIISLEVGQMFRPGAASFYSEEFYRHARARLAPGGIVSQFVPISFLSVQSFRSIVRTFREAFPNATLWYNTAELLLIGGADGAVQLSPARLRILSSDRALGSDLSFAYWGGEGFELKRPSTLLGSFLCGPRGLEQLGRNAEVDRDDHPVLDYATADAEEADLNELPILALLRAQLDPLPSALRSAADTSVFAAAEGVRRGNLADLAANAYLRRIDVPRRAGDYATVLRLIEDARRVNPDNLDAERLQGETLLMLGRDEEAQPHLRRVVAERPADAASRRALGLLLHRQRRFAEAIALYRASLALGPDLPETHNNLGAALAEAGDLRAAASEFERVLSLRPGDADALRNLGLLRISLQSQPGPSFGRDSASGPAKATIR